MRVDNPSPSNPHLLLLLLLLRLLQLLWWLRLRNNHVPVRPFFPTLFPALSLVDRRSLTPLT